MLFNYTVQGHGACRCVKYNGALALKENQKIFVGGLGHTRFSGPRSSVVIIVLPADE